MNTPASSNRLGAVVGAFVYLQATSLYNNIRKRVLRLRQPKYALGALAGAAYMYFFVFRHFIGKAEHARAAEAMSAMPAGLGAELASLVALALLLYVSLDWLFAGEGAKLGFSETEIAFLFPAPLTRTTLIQFNLLRAQLMIFFSSFLLGLLLRRGSAFNGHPLQYATGLWLLLSMGRLHALGAAFTRDRLAALGLHAWARRALVAVVVILLALACAWPLRGRVHLPTPETWSSLALARAWFHSIVDSAPLTWVLQPFRWAVAPIFAPDTQSFLRALPATLGLLVLHYLWVVYAQVSFEDASLAHAQKRAKKVADMRAGKWGQRAPTKARSEPFKLAAGGFPPLAFLWRGLIAMGPFYRPRTLLVAAAVMVAGVQWLGADPRYKPVLVALASGALFIGGWSLLLGPMMMQNRLQRTLDHLDILKATPLGGRQIALGELLAPATVMTCASWLVLLFATLAFMATGGRAGVSPPGIAMGGIGAALLVPPLCGLMLCVPFAAALFFPAWAMPQKGGGRGVEVMGQRLIFMAGYMLTLALAMIPALAVAALVLLLASWLGGIAVGLLPAAACACAVLALELHLALGLLGRRIDRFDVSQELR